jgi:hypothetical protein
MMASLIDVATALAIANPTRPSQSFLRRAVSTAYYAVFHAVAAECADLFIGGRPARAGLDWVRVFRALDHGAAKNACIQLGSIAVSIGMLDFASIFLQLQEERHRADYDPTSRYARQDALDLIDRAEIAIGHLRTA